MISKLLSAIKECISERLIQNARKKLEKWTKERGMKFSSGENGDYEI